MTDGSGSTTVTDQASGVMRAIEPISEDLKKAQLLFRQVQQANADAMPDPNDEAAQAYRNGVEPPTEEIFGSLGDSADVVDANTDNGQQAVRGIQDAGDVGHDLVGGFPDLRE